MQSYWWILFAHWSTNIPEPNHSEVCSNEKLSDSVKKDVFFELIFMTYSYVHRMINNDMFPNAINLFNKDLMVGRGRGKYMYKPEIKEEASKFFIEKLSYFFPNNKILYIV